MPLYFALHGSSTTGPAGTAELAVSLLSALVSGGVLIGWMQTKHPGWTRVVGWPSWSEVPRELAIGALLGLAVLFGANIASQLLLEVFRSAAGHSVELPRQVSSNLSTAGAILFAVYAMLVAPAVEELFFRGLLFRSLRRRHGVWIAALGSAIPFGLVHYVGGAWTSAVALQLTMVVTGIGLALVHERRGNLLANMASHAAFNTVAVVWILALGH